MYATCFWNNSQIIWKPNKLNVLKEKKSQRAYPVQSKSVRSLLSKGGDKDMYIARSLKRHKPSWDATIFFSIIMVYTNKDILLPGLQM